MPTDARQIAEMHATIEQQRDRALELLDQKTQTIEGWRRRFKEMTDQWVKETNENRAIIAALEAQIEELKRGQELTNAALKAEQEAHAAEVARRRSEGAKSGWEIRRAKEAK